MRRTISQEAEGLGYKCRQGMALADDICMRKQLLGFKGSKEPYVAAVLLHAKSVSGSQAPEDLAGAPVEVVAIERQRWSVRCRDAADEIRVDGIKRMHDADKTARSGVQDWPRAALDDLPVEVVRDLVDSAGADRLPAQYARSSGPRDSFALLDWMEVHT